MESTIKSGFNEKELTEWLKLTEKSHQEYFAGIWSMMIYEKVKIQSILIRN